jgi:DNA-directed RNA polymerase specialized sigma24 family protein
MDTLLELSKRHKEWLKMATKITSSSDKAQDLVQDMYLAMGLSDSVLREEYSNFIFTVMWNIFLNQFKKNNTFIEGKEVKRVTFVSIDDENEIF